MGEGINETIAKISQLLAADGGGIELVEADEASGVVKVRLQGSCGHCPFAAMTMKNVVEAKLKAALPWVKEVQAL